MNWPPSSPDLNPIEQIWAIFKHRIITSAQQAITEEWDSLTETELLACIDSLPKRMSAVIAAPGDGDVFSLTFVSHFYFIIYCMIQIYFPTYSRFTAPALSMSERVICTEYSVQYMVLRPGPAHGETHQRKALSNHTDQIAGCAHIGMVLVQITMQPLPFTRYFATIKPSISTSSLSLCTWP